MAVVAAMSSLRHSPHVGAHAEQEAGWLARNSNTQRSVLSGSRIPGPPLQPRERRAQGELAGRPSFHHERARCGGRLARHAEGNRDDPGIATWAFEAAGQHAERKLASARPHQRFQIGVVLGDAGAMFLHRLALAAAAVDAQLPAAIVRLTDRVHRRHVRLCRPPRQRRQARSAQP